MKNWKLVGIAISAITVALSLSCQSEGKKPEPEAPELLPSDPYNGPMGFTPWPYDFTEEAQAETYEFIHNNANLISHHLDGGIPWPEALRAEDFSSHLRKDWKRRTDNTPPGFKVLLSLTPISFARDGIAPYWGEKDNMPLPGKWQQKRLNERQVISAYTKYVLRAVEHFNPDFLAIGIESNMIITRKPEIWDEYLELNAAVYTEVKSRYSDLPVFSTVQYEHLRGKEGESEPNLHLQRPAVEALMKHSDLLALSTYRFGFVHNKYDETFFDVAESFGKQVAIAEMGAMSKTTKVSWMLLPASEDDQRDHMHMILQAASRGDFAFVVNWVAMDFDKMVKKLPKEVAEISKAWVHTGLIDKKGREKKALEIWRRHLKSK